MAIVEMKKVTLVAMNQDKPKLLRQMQRLGCVQVTRCQGEELEKYLSRDQARLEEAEKRVSSLDLAISRLSKYDPVKKNMFSQRPVADEATMAAAAASRGEAMELVARLDEIERKKGELRTRKARDEQQIQQLRPWENLEIPLERLGELRTANLILLQLPERALPALEAGAQALSVPMAVERLSSDRGAAQLLVAYHRSVEEEAQELIKREGGAQVRFPGMKGTVAMELDQLRGQIERVAEGNQLLEKEIASLAGNLEMLRVLRDVEAMERDRLAAGSRVLETQSAFLLTGWVPEGRTAQLEERVKRVSGACAIEFSDPGEDEKPPTLLKNNKFNAPFEAVINLFSLPDPHGIDPTFIMAPFFVCFFGMMVSDAGYGIVLGLLAAAMLHFMKPRGMMGQIAWIMVFGGAGTFIWGALFGGWFGVEFAPLLFVPMKEPLLMMGLCLGLGGVHLVVGMLIAAYMNLRRGQPWDALFDQVFWLMILLGLPGMFLSPAVGGAIAGAGALGVLFTAGRAKKGFFSKLIGGLGALYNITSYLSDILSYARLFGMGLATGVIGMVINTVATMLMGSPIGFVFAIVILVGGHAFNLGINALGAYVHACRLQYIEFFNKFYESGGSAFVPLSVNTRYVDIAPEGHKDAA